MSRGTGVNARARGGQRSSCELASARATSGRDDRRPPRERPQDIFDACHGRYRGAKRMLGRAGSCAKLDPAQPAGYQWRPGRARAAEYIADFELAGRRALRRPNWEGRRRTFDIYFVRLVRYRQAIRLVGVPAGTFDWWTQQIKQCVGRELDRAGLYPPWRYFQEAARGG